MYMITQNVLPAISRHCLFSLIEESTNISQNVITYGNKKSTMLSSCIFSLFYVTTFDLAAHKYNSSLQRISLNSASDLFVSIGNAVVVMPRFEIEKFLGAIERFRVTDLFVVPPVVLNLVKQKELCGKYDLSSVREILSGAAPLGKDLIDRCVKVFPQAEVFQGYGMTESCGVISLDNPKMGSKSSGSAGFLVPGVESRIVGTDTQQPLPPNQLGEIWVRGPNMMQGYLNRPDATNSTIDSEGWVHTGDLGYFDLDGRLYVVDRIKDIIKCKGFQVAPAELEGLLLTHPGILDAAVVPFPDDEAGQVPIAYVVRSSGKTVTEEEIKSFVAKQVATYKRLRRVTFVESIPKLASGKILRRELTKNATSKL